MVSNRRDIVAVVAFVIVADDADGDAVVVVVVADLRNLPLKFHQNWVSNG